MSDINLLPVEDKPKEYIVSASKSLRRISYMSVSVLIIISIAALLANLYFSLQTKSLASKEDALKKQILVLQETEQKLVLIENRLSGIDKILKEKSTKDQLDKLQRVLDKNPTDVSLVKVELEPEQLIVSVGATDSKSVTSFYRLLSEPSFNSVDVDSFEYSPGGYEVSLSIK